MNPLFGNIGNIGNMMQMLNQLQSNPAGMLQKAGFNIPANVSSPQDIIQHLMNSGQVNQQQVNQAQQMAQMFGIK